MALIAALGMYDRAETAAANNRLWCLIRDALRDLGCDAPETLTRDEPSYMQNWISPDLVFAQTCSLPYRAKLADKVTLIATPDYGVAGCDAGHYRSVYIARKDDGFSSLEDVAGLDFAYNEALSHSGWAAPYADHKTRDLPLRPRLRTNAHVASAKAVADGRADYAAIDALTWTLIQEHDRFANQLQIIGHTPPSPALPFITAKTRAPAPIRAALGQAIIALPANDRQTLHLRGLVDIPANLYLALPIPPQPATT